jgi:hypothetical protein
MSLTQLPRRVVDVIEGAIIMEFATVSAAGVPIDTPTYCFPSDDLSSIDLATGLSYPAKAERARRNPKVGLLLEGPPGEPVVSIRGYAAVRDANLRANVERYIAETGVEAVSFGLSWEEARKAVWYWSRIIVQVTPAQVMWWKSAEALDEPPNHWQAATTITIPKSDPSPAGKASPSSDWPQRTWQELAKDATGRQAPAHLTVCDAEGWPLPMRMRRVELVDEGFRLDVPRGAPFLRTGKATLTFQGVETFVGNVKIQDGQGLLTVERALPQHPLVKNSHEVLQPRDEVRTKLMARLDEETQRRGQPIPTIPAELPRPTRLAKVRQLRLAELIASMPGREGTPE